MMLESLGLERLPSNKDPGSEQDPPPSGLFSNSEARAMLEEFRALVRAGVLRVTPENEVFPAGAPESTPGQEQPQARMSSEEQMNLLDQQLVEWLERRRESKQHEAADAPKAQAPVKPRETKAAANLNIRSKVIDLLAQRILERWDHSDSRDQLRDEVIARVAEKILERWDREID